jgi:hypothetical protein
MLYKEIISVCSEIHTKHINTQCGQNVEFVNVKPGGTYSNHRALKINVKLTVTQLFTKFSVSFGARRLTAVYRRVRQGGRWLHFSMSG